MLRLCSRILKNLWKRSMLIFRVKLVQNNFFLISLADRFWNNLIHIAAQSLKVQGSGLLCTASGS